MPAKKSPANQALGQAIRAVRNRRGYAQETFAAHVEINRSYYGAIERGEFNITVDTLAKIAAGFRVQPSTLLRRARL